MGAVSEKKTKKFFPVHFPWRKFPSENRTNKFSLREALPSEKVPPVKIHKSHPGEETANAPSGKRTTKVSPGGGGVSASVKLPSEK